VCRYTTLCPIKAARRGVLPSGPIPSSSSREPRLTANITVNMFSLTVYYQTSVQDASDIPGPCSRTVHRHTLSGTHWCTCSVRTSRSSSLTCGPQTARTWIQSIMLFGVPFNRWSINVDDSRQSTSWSRRSSLSGTNCRSVSLIAPLVTGVAGLSASSSSKADTLNIWCKNCRMWQLL